MTFQEIRALEIFDGLPDQALHVLVDASDEVGFAAGDVLWVEGQPAVIWWVLLEGRLDMVRHVGRERMVMGSFTQPGQWGEGWAAFDPHGVYMVTGQATTDGRMLRVPVSAFRDLAGSVPLIRHFLDGLFQTAREIEASTRQREALVSLGRLSAGLAHELNNPAAAAIRAVEALETSMRDARGAVRDLAGSEIDSGQYLALDALLAEARTPDDSDALVVADREERLSDWMIANDVDRDWILAPALAAASIEPEWCDRVLEIVGGRALQPALDWLAATMTSLALMGEVRTATQVVSGLVESVKSYSQMDRGSFQRIDVRDGLESTLVVLAHRLRPGIEIVRHFDEVVPSIDAYPGELNQVWTSLVENAVDAMGGHGVLTLSVAQSAEADRVLVSLADTGTGMAPEVLEHAFDVFFTTKEVGMGTGLGLSIARRVVVERHGGEISIESQPGATIVRVSLPTTQTPDQPVSGAVAQPFT